MEEDTNNKNDEFDLLLQDLNNEASLPDPKFEENLKMKVLSKVKGRQSISFVRLFNFHSLGLALGVFVLFTAFIAIGTFGGFYLYNNNGTDFNKNEVAFTSEEKEEFLSNVIKNNSESVLNQELKQSIQNPAIVPSDIKQEDIIASYDREFNYSYSVFETTPGVIIGSCPNYYPRETERIENYFYFDTDTKEGYLKSLSYDQNSDLNSYQLWSKDDNYYYVGGKYAVKFNKSNDLKNEIEENMPEITAPTSTPIPLTVKDMIKAYFGEEAKIEKDGANTYIIVWESNFDCGEINKNDLEKETAETDTIVESQKLIYRSYVNTESFEITKEEVYLNSLNEANLLSISEATTEKSNPTFDEIQSTFTFDQDVEVKEASDEGLTSNEFITKLLKQNSIKLLHPYNHTYTLSNWVFMSDNGLVSATYLYDKEFYSETEKGLAAYQNTLESLNLTLVYENQNSEQLGIKYYKKDIEDDEILGNYSSEESEEIELIVDGHPVKATFYKTVYFLTSGGTEERSCDNSLCTTTLIIILESGDYKITIGKTGTGSDGDKKKLLSIKEFYTIDTQKEEDLNLLLDEIAINTQVP